MLHIILVKIGFDVWSDQILIRRTKLMGNL